MAKPILRSSLPGNCKDIVGNPLKLYRVYVDSQHNLGGIHVAANATYKTIADLRNYKVAISRLGSGSQLMAYVNAQIKTGIQ
jgi:ABC-type nitrate/sulfonate/bicarbonate transport system substrate-binding protein